MEDGSFRRSAGSAMGRGVALIVVAVGVGIALLNLSDDPQDGQSPKAGSDKLDSAPSNSVPESTDVTTPEATATTAPAPTPANTTVLVANGSETKGAARRAAEQLKAASFLTGTPVDMATKPAPTKVYFLSGFEAMAQQVATNLGIEVAPEAMPTPTPVADLAGAQVLVVIGADVSPRFAATG